LNVLAMMAEGRTNQAIAARLGIAERTVEKHCTNIFVKLDLPASADDHGGCWRSCATSTPEVRLYVNVTHHLNA
jgi:hypothetical protein